MNTTNIALSDPQLAFLKDLLQRVEIRGFEAPPFLHLIETIKAAETSRLQTGVEEKRPNH